MGLMPAAEAADISVRTARKWQRRHASEGAIGLLDRSSRPANSPRRIDARKIERAIALRRTQRLTYAQIAERAGLSISSVARACQAAGVARLPPLQETAPVRRYERKAAGELLHLDTKKLARFEQPGHRVTGDRTRYTPRAGWQALHVAIDDHSRVGFSLMLPDETAKSACAHLLAALRFQVFETEILGWERNGFWLLLKRLEKDRFIWPSADAVSTLTAEQLHWLLEGIDIAVVQRHAHASTRAWLKERLLLNAMEADCTASALMGLVTN